MRVIPILLSYLESFNVWSVLFRLLLAVVFGGIIGTERGRHGSPAGFRTHILVCLGASMTSLCSSYVNMHIGMEGDIFRISAQVISGIGFLGAGIILLRSNNTVAGLTTAAGMWVTASIGVALGYGFYEGALVATLICFCTAAFLTKMEHKKKKSIHFYIEITDYEKIPSVLNEVESLLSKEILFDAIPAKTGISGHIGFYVTMSNKYNFDDIKDELQKIDGIGFILQG